MEAQREKIVDHAGWRHHPFSQGNPDAFPPESRPDFSRSFWCRHPSQGESLCQSNRAL